MREFPRIAISGLSGDAGKTLISVGLSRLWARQKRVICFKKGPDYIDMAWLSLAAGYPCYNLDLFLANKSQVYASFVWNASKADVVVIEGNRGLYDGLDREGSVSTAELAKLLEIPLILIINCSKMTRTTAAVVLGCLNFDSQVPIKGIILNQLAHTRHQKIITACIEKYCHLPVVGNIPKLRNIIFPGRHLGLVPPQEHPQAEEAIENAAEVVSKYLDLKKIWEIASEAPLLKFKLQKMPEYGKTSVNIGIIRDSAFQFYYPENIEALKKAGAKIIEFSALNDDLLPPIDALYIGGGFPETHAQWLSANKGLRQAIKKAAEDGLPIYAECGGLMYLSEKLVSKDKSYPMAGVLPLVIGVSKKPQGHGYTILKVEKTNPYFKLGECFRGHEFHYSYVLGWSGEDKDTYFAFKMKRGYGIDGKHDGLCYKNVLATYTHLHALGTPDWASALIKQALVYKQRGSGEIKKLCNCSGF